MKRLIFVFSFGVWMLLNACAMQEDVLILNDKINTMGSRMNEIDKEMKVLEEQVGKARDELRNIEVIKSVDVISKKQANMGIQLGGVKEELMRLHGSIEQQENRIKEIASRGQDEKKGLAESIQKLSEQFNALQAKLADLERTISEKEKAGKETEVHVPAESKAAITTEKTKVKAKGSAQKHYEEAYKLYKENAYRQAMEKFRAFLKKYPGSELAGNARYWLGECYYQQERYEEAILEYEKVVGEHKGPKAPAALLKEGLAFHNLGEPETAKLVMEKLIEEYPKSEQAEVARAKLKKWGKK